MFKKSTLLLFAAVMLLSMLPLSMSVSAQNPDCEGDVTLTYWHHWGGNRIPLQEQQVAAFEDAHPGICVDNIFLPWDNRLQNWDEMLEVSEALRIGDGSFLERIGFNASSVTGFPFLAWLNANGQTWISDDSRAITINNEAGIETLEFMQAMADINYGIEEQNAFWEMAGEFDQGPLIQGLVSIEANGSWTLFQLEDHAETLNYDVAPIPYGPSGSADRRGGAHGGWGYMIPKNAAHPDEAWKLVKWLTTEVEGQGACWFIQQQQRPSPLIECNGYEKDGVVHPRAESILGVAALDYLVPVAPVQPEANQVLNRMVEDVLFGDSSIEDALASAEAEIQGLLDAFWEEYG